MKLIPITWFVFLVWFCCFDSHELQYPVPVSVHLCEFLFLWMDWLRGNWGSIVVLFGTPIAFWWGGGLPYRGLKFEVDFCCRCCHYFFTTGFSLCDGFFFPLKFIPFLLCGKNEYVCLFFFLKGERVFFSLKGRYNSKMTEFVFSQVGRHDSKRTK